MLHMYFLASSYDLFVLFPVMNELLVILGVSVFSLPVQLCCMYISSSKLVQVPDLTCM